MEPFSLSVKDLACQRGDRLLFRGLSFELKGGEALQIVGLNGTGKSSLLRIIAGLLRPLAGTVEMGCAVALLDDKLALDEHLPLLRAFEFWNRLDRGGYGVNNLGSRGLDTLAEVPVRFLSTGQRKRAGILLSNSRMAGLWLLDEPLNGLDAAAAAHFQDYVGAYLEEGFMAVIASHQPFAVPGARLRQLDLTDFTPPLQGRGRGWGMSADAGFADSPHPNPSPEGEGL